MLTHAGSFFRPQILFSLGGIAALEFCFVRLYRLRDLEVHVVETIAIAFAAGILYFVALYALEHTSENRATLWLVLLGAVLFRLTLAPLAPTLSEDIYRYRWDGRVQRAGWNPYTIRPDDPRLDSLRNLAEPAGPGHDIPAVYPPLSELTFRIADRFLPGPVAFKLPFIAADLLVVMLLAAWLRSIGARTYQLVVYAWNPLVIVEFAGSSHSDALALAALVGACVLIIRWRLRLSTILLMAAALFKLFPIMLMPLYLRRAGWPRKLAAWVTGLLAAAFALACAWPYRSALAKAPEILSYYASRWQDNNASLYSVLAWISGSRRFAEGLGVGIAAGLALWAAAKQMEPARAAYLIFGAILLLSPNAYPWYFTWIIPFLCFFPNPAWLLLTILQFLSYHVLIDYYALNIWHWRAEMVWLTYGPFYLMFLWEIIGKRFAIKPLGFTNSA
ncbi:MAG: glycosyltransferase 87 family protein [Candidatus Acidiferrales bacterium]